MGCWGMSHYTYNNPTLGSRLAVEGEAQVASALQVTAHDVGSWLRDLSLSLSLSLEHYVFEPTDLQDGIFLRSSSPTTRTESKPYG